jgi:LDH2 family malate/lactate/ureidoglycolate dehydrogenase
MKVKLEELRRVTKKALQHYGHDDRDAKVIQDVLLYAQLRDNNQGIVKLIGRGLPRDPEAGNIRIVTETPLSALVNGNKNAGIVVLQRAADIALSKAKEQGFSIVGTFNTYTSTGAIGYFARRLAAEDLIAFVFAGSPPSVSTFGSFERTFGTNPLAVGVPTESEPVVLDMATAAMAWYGLVEAKAAGEPIPDLTAYDDLGQLTTDPAKAMEGAILPFDRSHKGAGLSMIIEILTGPLVAASFAGAGDALSNWGNLVFAIDPALLVDVERFKRDVSHLVGWTKSAKKLSGVEEIYVPGERGDRLTAERNESGEIEIEENLYIELLRIVGQ